MFSRVNRPCRNYAYKAEQQRRVILRRHCTIERLEERTVFSSSPLSVGAGNTDFQGPISSSLERQLPTNDGSSSSVAAVGTISLSSSQTVRVATRDEFIRALRRATAGTEIVVASGNYAGPISASRISGTATAPIVIRAENPSNPPVIVSGAQGLYLTNVAYIEIHDLVVEKSTDNGIQIGDGGDFSNPAHHVLIDHVVVRDIGDTGNHDAIKLSGVRDFEIRNSVMQRWTGQGIDMMGCHNGLIHDNQFADVQGERTIGVQAKGASTNITIRDNFFVNAGNTAVQIGGGSSDTSLWRPIESGANYQAKNIVVERNVIVGSLSSISFINSDTSYVRNNTIYHPQWSVFRIGNETPVEGVLYSRNGVISRNIIVWNSSLRTHVVIDAKTQPETFQFSENWWYNSSSPSDSTPKLPVLERDGVYGIDPLFVNANANDFHLQSDSLADGYGAYPKSEATAALMAYWKLDETSGRIALDSSGAGNSGTLKNTAAFFTDTERGGVLRLTDRGMMAIDKPLAAGTSWTISAWFKNLAAINFRALVSGSNGDLHIVLNNSGYLGTYEAATKKFHSSDFKLANLGTAWHHISAVGEAGVTRFYLDGVFVGAAQFQATADILVLGNNAKGGQRFADYLDEVRVYDRSLSSTELNALISSNSTFAAAADPFEAVSLTAASTLDANLVDKLLAEASPVLGASESNLHNKQPPASAPLIGFSDVEIHARQGESGRIGDETLLLKLRTVAERNSWFAD